MVVRRNIDAAVMQIRREIRPGPFKIIGPGTSAAPSDPGANYPTRSGADHGSDATFT
jgi:hypothetical protein